MHAARQILARALRWLWRWVAPPAKRPDPGAPHLSAVVWQCGRALDHLFGAMDELSGLGFDPWGAMMQALGDAVDLVDDVSSQAEALDQPPQAPLGYRVRSPD